MSEPSRVVSVDFKGLFEDALQGGLHYPKPRYCLENQNTKSLFELSTNATIFILLIIKLYNLIQEVEFKVVMILLHSISFVVMHKES